MTILVYVEVGPSQLYIRIFLACVCAFVRAYMLKNLWRLNHYNGNKGSEVR